MRKPRCATGFTILELLVAIGVIALLLAILLPAVSTVREAARRTQCGVNLKQIGVALHNYHVAHRRFPLGAVHDNFTFWFDNSTHKGSVFVQLLPFIDEDNLYRQLDFKGDVDKSINTLTGRPVYESVIPLLICPSDDHDGYWPGAGFSSRVNGTPNRKRALSNYAPSMGNQYISSCGTTGNRFGTGPVDRGDTLDGTKISGVFSHMAWAARIRDIKDGTANTIAFGEIRPRCSDHARDGWMHVNSLWFATTAPINWPTCPGEPGYAAGSCNTEFKLGAAQGFKSRHPSGAQFLFCDGTVRFLSDTIDYLAYQRAGDRRDGGLASLP